MGRHVDYLQACATALGAATGLTLTVYSEFASQTNLDGVFEMDLGMRVSASEYGGDPHLEGYSVVAAAYMRLTDHEYSTVREALDSQLDLVKDALRGVAGYSGVSDYTIEWPPVMEADGVEYIWAALKWRTTEG